MSKMNDQDSLALSKAAPKLEEAKEVDAEDFGKDIGKLEKMTTTGWINIDEQGSRSSSPRAPKATGLPKEFAKSHFKDFKDKPAN